MPGRRVILRLAELLASAPTVSYREHEVLARVRHELDRFGISYASDRWGNLLARYRGRRPHGRPVAFSAHADHPGLIVTSCRGGRAEARWIGGVARRFFQGSAVRIETAEGPVRGLVRSSSLGADKRVARVRLSLDREVPVGSIGGWDLEPFQHRPPWIRTKSADDLLGCAAVVSLMQEMARQRPPLEVWGLFTRAEEDGLLGATALAQDGTLPEETAVVVLETSKELPCGRLGQGPVVRVGDRRSVYDPGLSRALHETAEELAQRYRSFRYQRCLMDGGVCEATTFQCFGYAAGGLALPLRNYHNMGPKGIAAEIVHEDDLWNLARLLPVAAERIAAARDGLAGLRARFLRRLEPARRELAGTAARKLVIGLLLGLLGAVGLEASPLPLEGAEQGVPTTKPGAPWICPPAGTADGVDPREAYDALHYELTLRIDPDSGTLEGELRLLLEALEDLSTVRLDLGETLSADSVSCAGLVCTFSRPAAEEIDLDLPEPLAAGDSAEIFLRYSGTPGPAFFRGFEFFANHRSESDSFPMISTLSQPDRAHAWWPCKDRMDDKATMVMTVDLPAGFVVAGNGNRMREEVEGERVATTWATSYPIAPYLVSFAATNYTVWSETYHAADGDSISLLFYAYPEDESLARADFAATHEALATFEERFGPYPFRNRTRGWEKLGVAEFAWGSAAMEHQTCISYGEGFVTGDHSNDWALAHEIAHQWWGDAVTPITMDDIWLNEGFATYCEALFFEARGGVSAYRSWMRRLWKSEQSEFPGTVIRPVDAFGGSTVYRKGAWVLHMLRGVLGEGPFFEALDQYAQRYRYGNATSADFIRAVEETTLEDLRWFFEPWLYGTGRPHIAWDWWSDPVQDGYRISLYLSQIQEEPAYPEGAPSGNPPSFFSFPLEVRIFGGGDSLSRTVFVDERSMVAWIEPVPFEPDSIALDPDEWILRAIVPRGEQLPGARIEIRPNPSAGRTEMVIHNPASGTARLSIYDIAGRRVRSLPAIEGSGPHIVSWDGRDREGRPVGSGLYLVRVVASSGATETARIVIVR